MCDTIFIEFPLTLTLSPQRGEGKGWKMALIGRKQNVHKKQRKSEISLPKKLGRVREGLMNKLQQEFQPPSQSPPKLGGRRYLVSLMRYEYEGLNLLRIDELYDGDEDEDLDITDYSNNYWRPINLYIHGPGSIGQIIKAEWYEYDITDPDAVDACDEGEYYYFYDALGNVDGVMEEYNNDWKYFQWEIDAFGNQIEGSNEFISMDTPGLKEHLTGKMYDTDTEMYYFHARWYDPEVGRFISKDKKKECFLYVNVYAFTDNNPINYTDFDGNMFKVIAPEGCGCSDGLWQKARYYALIKSTIEACLKVDKLVTPKNKELGECIKERCASETIICKDDCPKKSGKKNACGYTRYYPPIDPREREIGKYNKPAGLVVCPNLTSNPGATAIHEFGHACGCSENDIINSGCNMLPYDCGGNNRGF